MSFEVEVTAPRRSGVIKKIMKKHNMTFFSLVRRNLHFPVFLGTVKGSVLRDLDRT